jgi:hypothetical protein
MSSPTFESRLRLALRELAEGGVRPVDARATAEVAIQRGRRRWRYALRQTVLPPGINRRALAVLLIALLIAAALVAVGVGRFFERNHLSVVPPGSPSFEAIYIRSAGGGVDIVAVRPGGTERVVRRLESAAYLQGLTFAPSGLVSEDGWIALGTESSPGAWSEGGDPDPFWALLNLGDPRALVEAHTHGGPSSAWSANGVFASPVGLQCCPVRITNPRTGATQELSLNCCGGGPSTILAADGSGGLTHLDGDGQRARYALLVSASPRAVRDVPAMAFREARFAAPGGRSLYVCLPPSQQGTPDCADPGAWVYDGKGDPIDWTQGDVTGFVNASFTSDGQALWLVYLRRTGPQNEAVIEKAAAPGQATVVWRQHVPDNVNWVWAGAFALDDSLVTLSLSDLQPNGSVQYGSLLVSLRDGQTSSPSGSFAGYINADLVESWR